MVVRALGVMKIEADAEYTDSGTEASGPLVAEFSANPEATVSVPRNKSSEF